MAHPGRILTDLHGRTPGLHVASFATRSTDLAAVAAATKLRLAGISIRDTGAAVAVVTFRNGIADTAPIVAVAELAADTDKNLMFGDGLDCPLGIFMEVAAGDVEGAIYYIDAT